MCGHFEVHGIISRVFQHNSIIVHVAPGQDAAVIVNDA
jgi:hypothetical protein